MKGRLMLSRGMLSTVSTATVDTVAVVHSDLQDEWHI